MKIEEPLYPKEVPLDLTYGFMVEGKGKRRSKTSQRV